MNVSHYALSRGRYLMDGYASAMQSGTSGVLPLDLGVGQVARVQEAAEALGLKLAIVGPYETTREKVWEAIKDADVILLDGALDQKILPGKVFAKGLLEAHFFGDILEKHPTIFIRTSRPEAFRGLTVHD